MFIVLDIHKYSGDCFGLDGHLRISSALPREYLQDGLSRLNEVVRELAH